VENTAGAFYTATASDPNGDPLTYSISGGADAARFSISGSGALQFATQPNFDLPNDSNGDNAYEVSLTVSDGKASATIALTVTVSNSREGIAVRRILTGITNPVAITQYGSSRTLLVAERAGTILSVDGATGTSTPLGSLFAASPGSTAGYKVMAFAVEPNFATSRSALAMVQTPAGVVSVESYIYSTTSWSSNFGTVLAGAGATYSDDNFGWLGYHWDGDAFALIGDGGANAGTGDAAQDPASRLGKLFRIRRNPDPYAGASPLFFLTSVIGRGLHQPNGGSFFEGVLIFADRGRSMIDEINRIGVASSELDFGWPFKEGTETVRAGGSASATDPSLQYPRGSGPRAGTGIVGGQPYRGANSSLAGQYVFGDRKGAIWSIPLAQLRSGTLQTAAQLEVRTLDFEPDTGKIDDPVAFVTDGTGVLYVLDRDGELFRVDAG
jgi:hypothetical protein